jgi:hypothetical protein
MGGQKFNSFALHRVCICVELASHTKRTQMEGLLEQSAEENIKT